MSVEWNVVKTHRSITKADPENMEWNLQKLKEGAILEMDMHSSSVLAQHSEIRKAKEEGKLIEMYDQVLERSIWFFKEEIN